MFLTIFSALAVAMATLSGTNVQVATNQQQASHALASAQSGLEVARYYLSGVSIAADVAPEDRIQSIASST